MRGSTNSKKSGSNAYKRPGRKMHYCAKRKYHKNLINKKIGGSKSPSKGKKKKMSSKSSILSPIRYSFNHSSKPKAERMSQKSYSVCSYLPKKSVKAKKKSSTERSQDEDKIFESISTVSSLISSISSSMEKWNQLNNSIERCIDDPLNYEEEDLVDLEEMQIDTTITKKDKDLEPLEACEPIETILQPMVMTPMNSQGYSNLIRRTPKIVKNPNLHYNKRVKKKNKKGLTLTDSNFKKILARNKKSHIDNTDFFPLPSEYNVPRTTKGMKVKRGSFSGSHTGKKSRLKEENDNLTFSDNRGRNETLFERTPQTYMYSKYTSRKAKIKNSSINYSAINLVNRMSEVNKAMTCNTYGKKKLKTKVKKNHQSSTARGSKKSSIQGRRSLF
ncbi:unnamed protein product [Moneuplotes crassus]|uniref:Uncharacterized protein n=1 Tax=Euplotes crassus TaxID=5936 RepID=A0AAD1UF29_EUPCR|nr:unnamed protein product [Moneuplotes crassus]